MNEYNYIDLDSNDYVCLLDIKKILLYLFD